MLAPFLDAGVDFKIREWNWIATKAIGAPVDDAAVYNRVLSDQEVMQLYQQDIFQ
jgi:hypothetical protein